MSCLEKLSKYCSWKGSLKNTCRLDSPFLILFGLVIVLHYQTESCQRAADDCAIAYAMQVGRHFSAGLVVLSRLCTGRFGRR